MAVTYFDLTLRLAGKLGVLRTGTATGGGAGTTSDTSRTEADDTFNGGTIWLITDAGGAGAAPEKEFARITDFANTGGVITHAAFTAQSASGDTYGIATARYDLDTLISALNDVLSEYQQELWDTTSQDTVSGQSEYSLPTGITKDNLVGVYIQTNDDSDDNRWVPVNFEVMPAATGSAHTVVLTSHNLPSDVDLAYRYRAYITPSWNDADAEIDPIVPDVAILPQAAYIAELNRQRTYGSESKLDIEYLKTLREQADMAKRRWPIRPIQGRGKVLEAGLGREARVDPPPKP